CIPSKHGILVASLSLHLERTSCDASREAAATSGYRLLSASPSSTAEGKDLAADPRRPTHDEDNGRECCGCDQRRGERGLRGIPVPRPLPPRNPWKKAPPRTEKQTPGPATERPRTPPQKPLFWPREPPRPARAS